MAKLPSAFMQLSLSIHGRFDDLAETSDNSLEVLAELSSIIELCGLPCGLSA